MPKSLVLGNGNIIVNFNAFGEVDDFYYPYAGLDNNMGRDSFHRIGVWIEGEISWLDDGKWKIDINYQNETLASKIKAKNEFLNVELRFLDVVYNEKDIFMRKISIKNLANRKRTIKVFFGQRFEIYGISHGNSAYYDPDTQTIIHYKGPRLFSIGGRCEGRNFDDYSIGLIDIEGKEGTWKDAEDGILSKNAIEHGSVDSIISFSATPDAGKIFDVYYWIAMGTKIKEIKELHRYILSKTPSHLLESTQDFWYAWVNKQEFTFYGLTPAMIKLFKKSLLTIRTQVDNQGAMLASADSDMLHYGRDTYAYMWPRDAAFTVIALDKAGYSELSRNFFRFCHQIISDEGYFLHRYRPDKSLGSSWHPWVINDKKQLPIQEDETALVLYSFWEHYQKVKDLEFVERIYNSFVKRMADFMASYRDRNTGLPKSSYDLWEEKLGTNTFTASAVYAALRSGAQFAHLLGKESDEENYYHAALEIKEGILKYLYNEKDGSFLKLIEIKHNEILHDYTLDMSSFYGLFKFGVLEPGDKKLEKFLDVLKERLFCQTSISGIGRYVGDQYHSVDSQVPGNPWIITTLWLAQYLIKKAQKEEDMEEVKHWLNWTVEKALPSGILSEQMHPYTGEQLSASPLTWSHGEFVVTVIQYLEKLEELGVCKVCEPKKLF